MPHQPFLRILVIGSLTGVCLTGLATGADCVPAPGGIVGWWAAEGDATDRAGGPGGTVVGAAFEAGMVGQAFRFSGAGQGVDVPVSPAILPLDLSIEAWVRRSSMGQVAGDGGPRAWWFALGADGFGFGLQPDGRLAFTRMGGEELVATGGPITDLEVHHVAVTVALGQVNFYVDGLPAGAGRIDPFFEVGDTASIGRRPDTGAGSFLGLIDELSLYDRALSADEVAAIHAVGAEGKCPPPADVPNDVAFGDELLIQGSNANGHLTLSRDGFSVFGQLRLESANQGFTSALNLTSGTLRNEPGGRVVVNRGSGGPRSITGGGWNLGQWDLNHNTTLSGAYSRWRNQGSWTVAAGVELALRGTGVRFDQLEGTLELGGSLDLEAGAFRFAGGNILGQPYLVNSTLILDSDNAPAAFTLTGSGSRLLGGASEGQSLWVQGSNRGNHTTAVAPQGFGNAGLLLLQSVNQGFTSSLTIEQGTLTNLPTGVIRVGHGSGGPRNLSANELVNRGSIEVDWPLSLGPVGGMFRNQGAWSVAGDVTLSLGSGRTFQQEAGQLNIAGAFDGTQITFDYRDGTITGQPYLENSTLKLGPAATQPAAFTVTGSGTRLVGDLKAGQSAWVQGSNRGNHTTALAPQGFANAGLLLLQSANQAFTSSLTVETGTLANLPAGVIRVGRGAGGPRNLSAGEMLNQGSVEVDWPLSLGPVGGVFRNQGVWNMAEGVTLFLGSGRTFQQEAGRLNVAGGFDGSQITFDYRGGTITGQPYLENSTLKLGPAATEPVAFTVTGSGTRLVGDLKPGQSVWVQGSNRGNHTTALAPQGFVNAGLLLLQSANQAFTSSLTVETGTLANLPAGVIRVGRGAGGPRTLNASLENMGVLDIHWPLNLGSAGLSHRNQGDVLIDASGSINATGGQTWTQVDGLIDVDGSFTLRDGRFDFQGGLVQGGIYLPGSRLDLGRGGLGGSFTLTHNAARLHGESSPGITVTIQGNNDGNHTTARAPEGFVNHGTLRLTSANGAYRSSLNVEGGPLINQHLGLVEITRGAGGPRELEAAIINRGTWRVSHASTLGLPGEPLINAGHFEVLDSTTLRGPLLNSGGELSGHALISGEVQAPSGLVRPTGNLTITGAVQAGTGTALEVVLDAGKLTVNGPLTFNGLIRAHFPDGFEPVIGNRFEVVRASALGGEGVRFELPALPAGMRWGTEFTTAITLVIEVSDATRPLGGTLADEGGQPIEGVLIQATQTPPNGLLAEFWNGDVIPEDAPVARRITPDINYNWAGNAPDYRIDANHFVARWTGRLVAAETGDYTLRTRSNDGVRLWLDDVLLIDDWEVQSVETNETTVSLEAGVPRALRVEYFEDTGTALMALEWTGPGVDGVIPESAFRLPEDLTNVPLANVLLVSGTTGPDGRYSMLLPPGEWQILPVGLQELGFADLEPVTVLGGPDPVTVDFPLLPRVLSGPPDLIALDLQAPAEAAVGGNFELSWTTRNDGVSPATAPWVETVLLSSYASGFRGRVVGTVAQSEDLAAGAEVGRHLTVTVPPDLRGSLFAVVKVDSALQVDEEQFEGNNTTASAVPVGLRIADLQVVSITVPEAVTLGAPATIQYTVQNTGLVPAVGPWMDRVRFGATPSGGTALATTPAPLAGPLGPGEHYVNTVEAILPHAPGDQPGNRYFIVEADFAGAVPEESDANNSAVSDAVPAELPPPADLVLLSVTAPAEMPAGLPAWVEWSVRNDGIADAIGPWSDALQLALAADSPTAIELARVPFSGRLAPGATIVRSNLVLIPPALAGTHFVRVLADAANQLREDEDVVNNLGATELASRVIAPNLVVESLSVPASAVAGEDIEVSWTVRNVGTAPVPSGWLDRMLFDSPTSAILQIGAVRADVAVLPPDGVYEGGATIRLPLVSELAPAPYTLTLLTDAAEEVVEASETDNHFESSTIAVTLPPLPDLEVVEVVAPENPLPGAETEVFWTVVNRGDAPALPPWQESLALSPDDLPGADIALGTLLVEEPLGPGADLTRSLLVRLPANLAGDYWFVTQADPEGQVIEPTKANNVGISGVPALLPAKLTLDLAPLNVSEDTAPPTLRGRLIRSGPTTEPLLVSLHSSDPGKLTTVENVTLPAGASAMDVAFGIVADGVVDGVKVVTLTASAPDLADGEATVTVQDVDRPSLALTPLEPFVREGESVEVVVARPTADPVELVVSLTTTDVALVLPEEVIIPAEETEVVFPVAVVDDEVILLPREAEILALAEDHTLGRATLEVRDNDNPGLMVEVEPAIFSEAAGGLAAMGRVTRTQVTPGSLVVQLQVSDDTEVVLLPQVLIRGGQASAEFYVSAVNDNLLDGDQTVTLRAFVNDPGSAVPVAEAPPVELTVTDDDGPSLRVALGGTLVREGLDPALTGIVTRNSTPDSPLTVALASDDTTEATVPVEVIIPAGEASVTFPVVTLEDGVVDGNQRVTLTATAEGYSPAVRQFTVSDGDLPDLVVSELTVPASGLTRDLFLLAYRITNQGFDTTSGSPLQRVVLSRDPVLDAGDPVIDETPFAVNLPPGQSFSRELSLFLPGDTGPWWVFVTTDADNIVSETLEDNNTARSDAPVRVDAAYSAAVRTDVNAAPAGTIIPLYGTATRPGGQPAAGELVDIHVIVRGARRILSALTDVDGRFTANFQPLPSEGGTYTIGAVHPGVSTAPVQDTFSILGMRLAPNYDSQVILPGGAAVSEFDLVNLSEEPLTGIVTTTGAVEGIQVHVDAPTQLGPGATARVRVTSTVPEPRDAAGRFLVLLSSVEGATAEATIDYLVELPVPRLAATPHTLRGGMVRDQQTYVEFDIMNTGGAETGPLNITLPDAPWMSSLTESPMPSLQPGESTTIALALQPDATIPLQEYDGRLAISNPDIGILVPFVFRHVSDATGDLRVVVTDENTYYGDGANLAGAQVSLRDAISGEAVFTGVSDETGILLANALPEGTYNLEVTAPKHDNWLETIFLKPGEENEHTVFLRTQLLRYKWTVEEIEIEERATVKLETIFETVVPTPVVTVEPGMIDLSEVTADEVQYELKFTNQGLIAAQDVVMNFEDGTYWSVHPLVDEIGIIPAKSSITVPVIFRRIAEPQAARQLAGEPDLRAFAIRRCRPPTVGIDWRLICGPFDVAYWVPVPVVDLGLCGSGGGGGGGGGSGGGGGGFGIPTSPGGGGGARGFGRVPGRRFLVDVRVGTRTPTTYEKRNKCECEIGSADVCVTGEAGYKGQLKGFAQELVNSALASLAYTRLLGVEVNVNGTGKICKCCADVDGQGVQGLKAEASLNASITGKVWVGPSLNWEQDVSVPGLTGAKGKFFGGIGAEVGVSGYGSLKATTECLLQNPQICIEGGVKIPVFVGGKISGEVTGKLPSGTEISASAEGSVGFSSGVSYNARKCIGRDAPPGTSSLCLEAGVANATIKGGYQDVATGRYLSFSVGGEKEIWARRCTGESAVMLAEEPTGTDAEIIAEWMGYDSPAALAAAVAPDAELSALGAHPSGPELSRVLMSALPDQTVPKAGDTVFSTSPAPLPGFKKQVTYETETLSADEAREREAQSRWTRAHGLAGAADPGVCAQVRLVIEQEAVVTRKAIGATLEVINESEDTPIENLGVTINIYDAAGNLANDRFLILDPELTRLSLMDAPTTDAFILNGRPFQLAPATTGSARWVILPRDEAAPDEPQDYFVGGILAYTADGVPGSAELVPGQVSVYPNAKLYLKYFHQRDVFADDPFTDEVEPSIPFLLGVLIENRGNGIAGNLSITSGQPEIVENLKGLLIDFNIIATEVEGKQLTPSLTADFGDIPPHSTAIGRWYLKSTLQGLFIDYQATLEHEDRFGERGASVFEGVEIHEMIHQVEALGPHDDGRPDFLVNDEPDEEDLADTVHLSDATSHPVTVVRSATPDGAPTSNDLEVELTAPMPAGFAYLWVPDPAGGNFRLTGVRRSDGRLLEVGSNAWTTGRTFIGQSRPPRPEHRLHLFDHDSTGQYTLIYAHDEQVPDTIAPVSRVATLPPTSPAQIPLSWTGADDALGSGIAGFDLFVSTDNGPFVRWLENTRNTAAIYPGAAGRRYAFYAIARDAAGNVETAPLAPETTTLTTGNSAPEITSAPSVSVDEGQPVEVQVEAVDADLPGDTLTYSLTAGPPGAQIGATTGLLTWQTGENDGPRTHQITVRVTDNGDPSLSADRTLSVTVREVNQPVSLEVPVEVAPAVEGELWTLTLVATDPDLPRQSLRYRVEGEVPAGLTINTVSGLLTWIPGEELGGSTVAFEVGVRDGGTPEFTDTEQIVVEVIDRNSPPTLEPIADQEVWEGDLLRFIAQASDTDLPVDTLVFSLDAGAPEGAAIGPGSGEFSWIPVEAQAPGVHPITVRVTDNGTPVQEASRTFRVTTIPLKWGLNRPMRHGNGDVSFRFKGEAGRTYVLQASTDLRTWIDLREFLAEQAIFTLADQTSADFTWRFFRAVEAD